MSDGPTKQRVHKNPPKIERLLKGWRLYGVLMLLSGLCLVIGVGLDVRGPVAVILYSLSRLFFMPIPIRLMWGAFQYWQEWTMTPFQNSALTWLYRGGFAILLLGMLGHIALMVMFMQKSEPRDIGMGVIFLLYPWSVEILGFIIMVIPLLIGKSEALTTQRIRGAILFICGVAMWLATGLWLES